MLNKLKKIYPFFYGAFGSLGFWCYASVFCVLDYRPSEHPYAHPFCVIAGIISLACCLAVFCFDISAFIDEERKFSRLLREITITICSFFVFSFIWLDLWNAVSAFIKYKGW
ncbi:MAG: hypothetical protein K2K14_07765 [Ruminococcus sp.]|nr:hypothetical protein [Ruminococcus sp.]